MDPSLLNLTLRPKLGDLEKEKKDWGAGGVEKESAVAEGERGNRKSKEMYVREEKVRNTSLREN